MALEIYDHNPVIIDLYFDAGGELQARHETIELAPHRDSVVAHDGPGNVAFELRSPSGAGLTATHEDEEGELCTWNSLSSGVAFQFSAPTTYAAQVQVVATESGTGTSKTKKILIDAKPGSALPDRP